MLFKAKKKKKLSLKKKNCFMFYAFKNRKYGASR